MRDFLLWLWDGYLGNYAELRVIGEQGYRTQRFYPLWEGIDRLCADARNDDDAGLECYVSVIPRFREGGKAEDTNPYSQTLFVDVDGKHNGGKPGALARIIDFPVPPSVIVDSGNGYHAYFRLDKFYHFDAIEPIIRGIIQRVGGDPGVHDRARILRIPGLSNHKHGGNAPVRLIRFDTTLSYRLSDLAEFEYREPDSDRIAGWTRLATSGFADFKFRTTNDSAYLDERIQRELNVDPGKGARSGHDFYVACLMVEAGYSDTQINMIFESHPQGVGAKTCEAGPRYLERTIRKARQAVGR